MDRADIDAKLAEIAPNQESLALVIEGLADYAAMDLNAPARREVDALRADTDRRLALMQALVVALVQAGAAIDSLLADGYPTLPKREIDPEAAADLEHNLHTLSRAHLQFARRALTTEGTLEVGTEEGVP